MMTALLCRECKKSGSLRCGDRIGGSISHEPCQGCGKPRIVSEYSLLDGADGDSAGHTPGPWYVAYGNVSDADEGFSIASKIDTGRGTVCECWPCSTDLALRQRLRADARLITAAPDLLEALRQIAEGNLGDDVWQANYDRIRDVARAAIARAEAPQ